MSDDTSLRSAFLTPEKPSKNVRRARRSVREALSPFRILWRIAMVPVVTLSLTIGIFARYGPYEQEDALKHLYAMKGCDAAAEVGLSGAFAGELGYHSKNDPDGDGIACPVDNPLNTRASATPVEAAESTPRVSTGAKFIRP